jgi:hypothetical protein
LPWLAGNRIILTMKAWTKPYGDRIDRAGLLLSLAILLGAMGCEDKNPLGDDFGVDLPEPLTVRCWGISWKEAAAFRELLSTVTIWAESLSATCARPRVL